MIRLAMLAVLASCFIKPPYDGPVAEDAAVEDGAIDVLDAPPGVPANVAFVTATTYTVGMLGSLDAADTICDDLATTAGLPPNTYVAWLSVSGMNAINRLGNAQGWVRPDGIPFATTKAGLVAGEIYSPLRIDENKDDVGSVDVGTATTAAGINAAADCNSLQGNSETILLGISDAARRRWTDDQASITCTAALHMYCFGTELVTGVVPIAVPGRIAFVSPSTWQPGEGVASADTFCTTVASSRSLPGTYSAFLATSGVSAAQRLAPFVTGLPWVRLDGLPLANDPAQVVAGLIDVPLNVDVNGTYIADEDVYTGINGAVGSRIGQTCDDWTDGTTASNGHTGSPTRTSGHWFASQESPVSCINPGRLYCFQQ